MPKVPERSPKPEKQRRQESRALKLRDKRLSHCELTCRLQAVR